MNVIAEYYTKNVVDIEKAVRKIKSFYDEIKKIELYFFNTYDINIVLEDDAIDHIIEQVIGRRLTMKEIYQRLVREFEYGLKLAREKIGKNRFFITRDALISPESYIANLIKDELKPV
jgi:hypothetical protein